MAGQRQLDLGGEDAQRAALRLVDEHRLGEPEVRGDRLALVLRHLFAGEEDPERIAARPVGGAEDAQHVQGRRPGLQARTPSVAEMAAAG